MLLMLSGDVRTVDGGPLQMDWPQQHMGRDLPCVPPEQPTRLCDLGCSGSLRAANASFHPLEDPLSILAPIAPFCDEFRPDPLCHRRLWQISEDSVRMDLFTPGLPRLPHDGERLHRSHPAAPLPRLQLELGGRSSVLGPGEPELQPPVLSMLLHWRPAAGQPDRGRSVWPRMGVQPGDFPEHHGHWGTWGN